MNTRKAGFSLGALVLMGLVPLTTPARDLDESQCRRDSQALLSEIEASRETSLEQYRQAIAEADTESEKSMLKEQMEMIWHEEEQMLGIADQMLRDCLRHVRGKKAVSRVSR